MNCNLNLIMIMMLFESLTLASMDIYAQVPSTRYVKHPLRPPAPVTSMISLAENT